MDINEMLPTRICWESHEGMTCTLGKDHEGNIHVAQGVNGRVCAVFVKAPQRPEPHFLYRVEGWR